MRPSNSPREDRAVQLLATAAAVERMQQLLQRPAYIDVILGIGRGEYRLGPLGPTLEGAYIGMELYSARPTRHDARVCVAKLMELADQAQARGCRGAALVVLCRGGAGGLRSLGSQPTDHAGWSMLTIGDAQLHLLEAHRLASDGTWAMLRLVANPAGVAEETLLAELLGDPYLPTLVKKRIYEAFMNNEIASTTPTVQRKASEILQENALREGVDIGRQLAAQEVAEARAAVSSARAEATRQAEAAERARAEATRQAEAAERARAEAKRQAEAAAAMLEIVALTLPADVVAALGPQPTVDTVRDAVRRHRLRE